MTLAQATGTAPFDADDALGHDSDVHNDVIRTNDTVTYTVGIRFEGVDQTDPSLEFTLPRGEELVSMPPFCLSGSSVSPEALPAPSIPITASSWQGLPSQTIVCVVADQEVGSSFDYKFVSKVRPEVPDGTALDPVSASATSNEVTTPSVSPIVSHRVSAQARFDVSKRATATSDTTGPLFGTWGSCSFDTSRACRIVDYPLTINTPSGGKGITPLASPIKVTDDLSPDAFFGPGTTSSAAWLAAGAGALDKYGARLTACNSGPLNVYGSIPHHGISGGGYTKANSVRTNGTITCPQVVPGTPVQITITGADTTAYTVPTKSSYGSALPADTGYVVSTALRVEVPIEAVRDLGQEVGGVTTLKTTNELIDFEAVDINGAPNQGEDPTNNIRESVIPAASATGSFAKGFSGVHGNPNNTPTGQFTAWEYEGPPGSGSWRDGNTVVVPGQTVLSNLFSSRLMPPGTGYTYGASRLMCDTWDDSKLRMPEVFNSPASPLATRVQYPSNGKPAWISSWNFGTGNSGFQSDASGMTDLIIQYGYTATPGNGANSECADGVWADTPAGVPGATVQDGVWTGVNRVRFFFNAHAPATGGGFDVNASVALRVVASGAAVGTVLPNWASQRGIQGGPHTLDEVLAGPAGQANSTYVPATHAGNQGDRLILGTAAARIKKYVKNPSTGGFTDTTVPQYTAGSKVDYRLNPSLTADVSAGVEQPVMVEDCLPEYQEFISSERESGAALTPDLVQDGAPVSSELECPAGQTYVRWDLGDNIVNEAIDPIVVTVELSNTVRNEVYTNNTLVSTPGDVTPVTARDDSVQIAVVTPTGIKISKRVDKAVVEVNPAVVDTPRSIKWTIDFANIDAPENVSDVDVIDVLPANGVNGSVFHGALQLGSVDVAAGTGIRVLYTKNASDTLSLDPDDPTNGPTGATTWCSAAAGGTVVSGSGTDTDCPVSMADVNGLRFLRPGDFLPTDKMTVAIAMTPTANTGGDLYENHAAGRVEGVTQGVGPAIRRVKVIESAVGNLVWEDLDEDGVQDADEPGIAGFPVKLVGKDLDGNPVALSTTTDLNGVYWFKGLASGRYKIVFDPNGLTSNSKFAVKGVGRDDTIDSDGDTRTGETSEFVLSPDSIDPSWDQGLIINRDVDISVDKRLVRQSEVDDDNHATVTYELVVSNVGTAEGTYELADELKFGGDIRIDAVTASSTDPGGIKTDPGFDGIDHTTLIEDQRLEGGGTHVYEVAVEATLNTSITRTERDCRLAGSETGTGFLNQAHLTVDDETQTDRACAMPSKPPKTPSRDPSVGPTLPDAGGPALWTGITGIVALIAGILMVVRRREHEDEPKRSGKHRSQ